MSCNDKRFYAEKPCIYKFSCGYEVCMMEECPEYVAKTKENKYLMPEDDGIVEDCESCKISWD